MERLDDDPELFESSFSSLLWHQNCPGRNPQPLKDRTAQLPAFRHFHADFLKRMPLFTSRASNHYYPLCPPGMVKPRRLHFPEW